MGRHGVGPIFRPLVAPQPRRTQSENPPRHAGSYHHRRLVPTYAHSRLHLWRQFTVSGEMGRQIQCHGAGSADGLLCPGVGHQRHLHRCYRETSKCCILHAHTQCYDTVASRQHHLHSHGHDPDWTGVQQQLCRRSQREATNLCD